MTKTWRRLIGASAIALMAAADASAQDLGVGARRAEWGGFPTGVFIFARHTPEDPPDFTNYAFGTSFAWNLNTYVGLEAEAGFGVGWTRAYNVRGVLVRQPMPDSAAYSGSVVISPIGNHRVIVPYVVGGMGALSLLPRDGTETVGVTSRETMLTGNVGGGLKWYSPHEWGVRLDYRLLLIDHHDEALPLFGESGAQVGHRLYAGLFFGF